MREGHHTMAERDRLTAEIARLQAQLETVTRERDEVRTWYNEAIEHRGYLQRKGASALIELDEALEREKRLRDHIADALDLRSIGNPLGAAEVLREALAEGGSDATN